ncbi:FadR family transcriptional regulator [Mycobacterium lepromatosis]|nr:FadR family transcriptional regulator [Mycobacterium lepromatosis]
MPFIGVLATQDPQTSAGDTRPQPMSHGSTSDWRNCPAVMRCRLGTNVVAVEHVNQWCVEAISDADDSLARYHIHRHRYAVASWWL